MSGASQVPASAAAAATTTITPTAPTSAFPYVTRLDVAYGPLEVFDDGAIASSCPHRWFNQTLCAVNSSVVRVGVVQGEYHWHHHPDDDEFFYCVDGLLFVDVVMPSPSPSPSASAAATTTPSSSGGGGGEGERVSPKEGEYRVIELRPRNTASQQHQCRTCTDTEGKALFFPYCASKTQGQLDCGL
ncbi:cyclic nucleotide-binding protein [Pelomyxa schiedti]|nr:cyclic nucleotide-binding protein [Pelomyxa schiedti]